MIWIRLRTFYLRFKRIYDIFSLNLSGKRHERLHQDQSRFSKVHQIACGITYDGKMNIMVRAVNLNFKSPFEKQTNIENTGNLQCTPSARTLVKALTKQNYRRKMSNLQQF